MNKVEALHNFWSSFGLPAYDETHVPDGSTLPYITYEVSVGSFGNPVASTASLWYYSDYWDAITLKEMEIANAIGRGGKLVAYDGGLFWIKKASPWAQRMSDGSSDMIRRIVLNVEIEFID